MVLKTILLYVLIVWLVYTFLFNGVEHFNCLGGNVRGSPDMCHQIAHSQCKIPTYPLNDCWLNAFKNCNKSCQRYGTKVCDCDRYATSKCTSSGNVANSCYNSVHQKCMANFGLAPDPDRG